MSYIIPTPSAADEGSYSVKLTNAKGIETTANIVNIVKVVGAVPEVPPQGYDVPGDTNCDGTVELSDAILIMQSLANPNKYGIEGSDQNHLTEQGRINGDVEGGKNGLTSNDALEIQRKLLGLITDFAK